MKLPFRQGIVRAQTDVSQNPNFLQKTSVGIDLLTANDVLTLSFSHGDSEYSYTESSPITTAWSGSFQTGADYYLYVDLNPLTAERTFGFTKPQPTNGPTSPQNPENDQHWFDMTNTKTKVWDAGVSHWVEKIRVFVAKLKNGNVIEYIFPIGDSQVGISRSLSSLANFYPSGRILFGDSGHPVKKPSGEFFTTEDNFYVGGSRVDSIRLESNVISAIADQIISGFSVVKFNSAGKIVLANYADIGHATLAIVTSDLMIGDSGSVIIQGAIVNPSWANMGWNVNDELWVKDSGELVNHDPNVTDFSSYPIKQVPVARVVKSDTIIFEQGLGGIGKTGPSGGAGNISVNPASNLEFGTVKLLTPSSSVIVVSDDDPRLVGGPYASLNHSHTADDIVITPVGDITSLNLQAALGQISANKVSTSGDTLTGFLTLHANPTNALHSATKAYVDSLVNGLVWISPVKFINLIADNLISAPPTPHFSDMYIPAAGAGGAWSGLAGHLVQWDGTSWLDRGLLSSQPTGTRMGVAMETPSIPSGTFAARENQVATLINPTLGTWSFTHPNKNEAILINNDASLHAWHQYVFDGTNWMEFAGPQTLISGNNISIVGNVVDTIGFSDGGYIDARFLQGLQPSDFVSITGDTLTGPLILSGDPTTGLEAATKDYVDAVNATGGAPSAADIGFVPAGNLSTLNVQDALEELDSEKLSTAGGSMTGPLTLSGAPPSTNDAISKGYLDAELASLPTVNTVGYHHTQAVAASTWGINHALGTEFVNVSVYVDTGGYYTQMIPTSVKIIDVNNVEVAFSTSRSGRAVIVGVI